MNKRVPLVVSILAGSYSDSFSGFEEEVPRLAIMQDSELDLILKQIKKPHRLIKTHYQNKVIYYAEFETEVDALEYSLKLEPYVHDYTTGYNWR